MTSSETGTGNIDVILAAAVGYRWEQVALFLTSLRRTGYDGEVILFVSPELSAVDATAMETAGATLVPIQIGLHKLPLWIRRKRSSVRLRFLHRIFGSFLQLVPGAVGRCSRAWYSCLFNHVALSRYAYYLSWVESRQTRYRHIMLSDVRDVVFQSNPLADPPIAPLVCVLESDEFRLGTQPSNSKWVMECYGKQTLTELSDRRVSCSGTTLGTAAGVQEYLRLMVDHTAAVVAVAAGSDGYDQGIHNYLLWTGRLPGVATAENGYPVLTTFSPDTAAYRITAGRVYNSSGLVVPVLHQYDRCSDLYQAITAKRLA